MNERLQWDTYFLSCMHSLFQRATFVDFYFTSILIQLTACDKYKTVNFSSNAKLLLFNAVHHISQCIYIHHQGDEMYKENYFKTQQISIIKEKIFQSSISHHDTKLPVILDYQGSRVLVRKCPRLLSLESKFNPNVTGPVTSKSFFLISLVNT